MNMDEQLFLLAERGELERMLAMTSEEDVIDRISLQRRLELVNAELEKIPDSRRNPFCVQLTFRGKPVVGSHGIDAEFGVVAVQRFTDAVAAFTANFANQAGFLGQPLTLGQPLPDRTQRRLLITGTAIGSFGFELEEPFPSQDPDPTVSATLATVMKHIQTDLDLVSPTETAVRQMCALMQASVASDDDGLADVMAEADPSAIKKLHEFIKFLADREAVCAIAFEQHAFQFRDAEEVLRSVERLSQGNLHEQEQTFSGLFMGVLPEKRDFEFRVLPADRVIRGKVGKSINNVSAINQCLHGPSRITVQAIRLGKGRPHYLLLDYAAEPQTGDGS
ncbi:MAG: hypothetical protein H7833_11935 [Magnetococcus sp. DMHC-1]|nr:hypothetical protein [Magnetococcales bacterium]